MTHLVAWLCCCLVVAWLLRARPEWAGAFCLVLWSLVPAVAGRHLTGLGSGPIAFHPASWFVLCVVAVQLVVNPRPLAVSVVRHGPVHLAVLIFAIGAFLTSQSTNSGGSRLLVDQIVGPFLLWCLIVAYAAGDVRQVRFFRNTVLVTMAFQSALAVTQSLVGSTIFYTNDYLNIYWFDPESTSRWFGTTDSPLALSLGLVIAGALAIGLRSSSVRLGLLVVYFLGMLITQSRTGAAALILVIAISVLQSRMVLWARALTVVAVGVTAYLVTRSTLVTGLSDRVSNDTGSTDARVRALGFVVDHWTDFFATGRGLISSYSVARDAGLQTSLESAYLMYAVDTGIVLATIYFGTQIALVVRYGGQRALPGATLAALLATLIQHTFSSIGFSNLDGTFIWASLALVVVARGLDAPEPVRGRPSAVVRQRTKVAARRAPVAAQAAVSSSTSDWS